MARVKVTSSDIYARLAKGECANFRNGCQGRLPCAVINGEACQYFDDYVRPLLDTTEFAQRYAREAKVKLALNPDAKVVRKRRQAGSPTLDMNAESARAAKKPGKPAAEPEKPMEKKTPLIAKAAPAPKAVVQSAPVPVARKAREKAPAATPVLPEVVQPRADKTAALPANGARRQEKRGPVAEPAAIPALHLEVIPEAAPKHAAAVAPSPPAAAKITPAKPAPAEKQTITITPQLELVLDFPLERPARRR